MWRKNKIDSLVGQNTSVKGEIDVKSGVRIDGKFEGKINAEWVVIGKKAEVKGEINAHEIIIWGKVNGKIFAKNLIEIQHTGFFEGELFTNKLAIAEGGFFQGRSSKFQEKPSITPVERLAETA